MATTIRAVFDGEVLRPEEPLPLRAGATYVVTVAVDASDDVAAEGETESEAPYALAEIGRMAIDMGIEDLAARHDWYAHGRLPDDDPR